MGKHAMNTFSGSIDLEVPDPADIRIEDIAHQLSLQCRWGGCVRVHYSVAQHCVHCAEILPTLACLMHDAAEYVYTDVPAPVRELCGMELYNTRQDAFQGIIAAKYNFVESADVHNVDMLVREAEREDLLGRPPRGPRWSQRIVPWTPAYAEQAFLIRFKVLSA